MPRLDLQGLKMDIMSVGKLKTQLFVEIFTFFNFQEF